MSKLIIAPHVFPKSFRISPWLLLLISFAILADLTASFTPSAIWKSTSNYQNSHPINMLKSRYLERLGLSDQDEATTMITPSKENLDRLVEAHLQHVTFDNLSQHGLPYPTVLDVAALTEKLLDQKRGGFCFELNGLFAELLIELGYLVKRVPAVVHVPAMGFRHTPTHMILLVGIPSDKNIECVVDVGFGEPSIHSLEYTLDVEQKTPEGIFSRMVTRGEDPSLVILEWKQNGEWAPRLQWEKSHPGQALMDFQPALDVILGDESIFSQKLIVCTITRNEKLTLAGTRLKRTSPRFGPDIVTSVEQLESLEQVQEVLGETFRVSDSQGLDLTRSKQAAPEVWAQL